MPFNYLLIFGVEFLKAIVLEANPISVYESLIFSLQPQINVLLFVFPLHIHKESDFKLVDLFSRYIAKTNERSTTEKYVFEHCIYVGVHFFERMVRDKKKFKTHKLFDNFHS